MSTAPAKPQPEKPSEVSEANQKESRRRPHLPVLIIPGFMSSGLKVESSDLKQSWVGKRIWINLGSLGIEAAQFGKKGKLSDKVRGADKDKLEQQQQTYKSLWLEHMALAADCQSESPSVTVRSIEGLAGVDYLTSGALMNFLSYVFGPVIAALERVGYREGENMDAMPYDWRLAPSTNQERDQYFSRAMTKIEQLYRRNGNVPVCLLCHSMGCKMGHYLLNFAKQKAGQKWIDKHVHTWIPVGAPHLGAPAALRSLISGDKMGLEAFLTNEQALIFGRSLGSAPWLLPAQMPPGATSCAFMRHQGRLTVRLHADGVDMSPLLARRQTRHMGGEFKLSVTFGKKTLTTDFIEVDSSTNVLVCDDDKFVFATLPNAPISEKTLNSQLWVSIAQPGVTTYHQDQFEEVAFVEEHWNCGGANDFAWFLVLKWLTCYCLWRPLLVFSYYLTRFLAVGAIETADALTKATGGYSTLALSPQSVGFPAAKGTSTVKVDLVHCLDLAGMWCGGPSRRVATCKLVITWEPWAEICTHSAQNKDECDIEAAEGSAIEEHGATVGSDAQEGTQFLRMCSPVARTSPSEKESSLTFAYKRKLSSTNSRYEYSAVSGNEVLCMEDLDCVGKLISTVLDNDPLGPRALSATEAPPVKRIKAIYGVNVPTEVGAVYRKKNFVENNNKLKNAHCLDTKATLLMGGVQTSNNAATVEGYTCENGILKETRDTPYQIATAEGGTEMIHRSGDGTVPCWSLQHVRTWSDDVEELVVDELDGVLHRDILADEGFHNLLLDYVTRVEGGGGSST